MILNAYKTTFFTLLIAIFITSSNINAAPMMLVKIKNIQLNAEIANNNFLRKKGLMYRKKLNTNQAMIFIFKKPKILSFWMKNTKIPLSIAFVNGSGIITQIEKMTPFSLKQIVSKEKCSFALEVNQGFFKQNNINVGDEILF